MVPIIYKKRKRKCIPMPFNIVKINVKISSILTKIEGFFRSFNMKEAHDHCHFDMKGIFYCSYGINQLCLRF